jgi:pyruvate,water dikinase
MCIRDRIIVTGMTTPDFVPVLVNKAAGLVTDEGGILCHAAIIAREISLPCITGTGKATEKLCDGMRIRMDLDRETIKVLSGKT